MKKLSAEKFTIHLPRPFRIAHGTSNTRETILVHLYDEASGFTGHGEGALPPYYPSTAPACLQWLKHPNLPAPAEAAAAQAALDTARLDLHAQCAGSPAWKLFPAKITRRKFPPCTRTISIPLDAAELKERLAEGWAMGSMHFKLKLGSGDLAWDRECFRVAASTLPEAHFSIDANAGWLPGEAARIIPALAALGVDFIEQPVAREWTAWQDLRQAMEGRPLPPLVADESLQTSGDIARARELADGVNIKLLKAGGLSHAHQWIIMAREAGLRVMIGVMVETGIGRTAAAQLAHLADWLDIDPPDSIPMEPLSGIRIQGDHLTRSESPGLGLKPCASA